MSFVVSFNGQFKPYILPDLSHFDRVSRVYKAPSSPTVETDEANKHHSENKTSDKHLGIKSFEEVDAQFKKERTALYAKDLMSSPVHTIQEDDKANSLRSLFEKFSIRHVPVLNFENTLVGIISDRDILKANGNEQVIIKKIMTSEVLTAKNSARVADIAKLMLHEKLGALPVVDDTNRLVGIVTMTDILSALIREWTLTESA
jgi:predicted transcriptional regulator